MSLNIGNATASDLNTAETSYTVPSATTDGPTESKETEYINQNWTNQLGYYKHIPELKAAIDAKANWTVGIGYTTNEITEMLLMRIRGFGKDTFITILENMVRTYHIGGDSFAEIIRDNEGYLVNLKPLDPSTMKIIANKQGMIIRYEQVSKTKQPNKPYTPDNIFHLSRNRVADEIHGESMIDAVEWIILARNEAMADFKKVMHRNVAPMKIHKLNTEDETKIAAYKTKVDAAGADFENMYTSMGSSEVEILAIPPNASMNPLQWVNNMTQYFYQACNTPQVIMGSAIELTDASAKITYLAFEQNTKGGQLYLEQQVLAQLNLEIVLNKPASLQNDMISGNQKDGQPEAAEPNDVVAETEGRK